jgi:NADPH:quinone reductase-like Zn-dependent oxidoreductase
VALADGAGEVTAVGPGVSRFQVGDRVVGAFFAEFWIDGRRLPEAMGLYRGGPGPGMLSEIVVGNEQGFVRVPDHLSYEEAATLPTAAVTAWVSLFKYGGLQPNDYVLLEGTSLSGSAGPIPIRGLSSRDIRMTSFFVGSRADFEQMNRFIEGHQIRPIIDRVFEFEEAPEAFDFIESGDFMGKIVVRL